MILLIVLQIIISIAVIWSVSSSFEMASNYLGRNLSDGVKGATINAIGSSIPELLTTFIFLFSLKNVEGFTSGLTTTVGSAMFNILVIPALVILTLLFSNKNTTVQINRSFFLRDTFFLIISQLTLLAIIKWGNFNLISSILLVVVYLIYMFVILTKNKKAIYTPYTKPTIEKSFLSLNYWIINKLFKKLNTCSAVILLLVSVLLIGVACHLLVLSCEQISHTFTIPIYTVAIIVAAISTSVPDTVLSIKDAKNGYISDALSNAIGSNIFDITFALGLPLLIFSSLFTAIEINPNLRTLLSQLMILLIIITLIAASIIVIGKKVNFFKGISLILIYIAFVFWIYLNF